VVIVAYFCGRQLSTLMLDFDNSQRKNHVIGAKGPRSLEGLGPN
jgi:hypothetical protein